MSISCDRDLPEGFTQRVHQALRAYHTPHTANDLDDLLLARRIRIERGLPAPRLTSNQILTDGLDGLKQTDAEAADLLQRRFLNMETALEIAYRRNVSEDIIFQRQRAAITQLAQVIWNQELELRQRQVRRLELRLEPPTYSRLFGVRDQLAEVRARLETAAEPWLIALEGLGGSGKTSLADAVVRELIGRFHFVEIGWVSARRRLFRLSGDIETLSGQPDLTPIELADRLIDQFELAGLKRQSDADRLAGIREFLRARPCLIVLDNLETVADYGPLVAQLSGWANPTKFLMTTRYSLRDLSGVYPLTLKRLSKEDTLDLVRYEAETRGLPDLASASRAELEQIYDVTGGNPLATKLFIGQIHTLSLPTALAHFRAAQGRPVEELLTYVYDQSWQGLDPNSRQVLQAMLLVIEEGGRLEQIAAAAELDPGAGATCLQRLTALSLVNVSGGLKDKRYALHPLTQTYLARHATDTSPSGEG